MKPAHPLKVLHMQGVLIGLCLRIDPCRTHSAYRISNVVGAEAAGKKDGDVNQLDDASADAPVVRHAKRADLPVKRAVAVEQKVVGKPIVVLGDAQLSSPKTGTLRMIRQCGSFFLSIATSAGESSSGLAPR